MCSNRKERGNGKKIEQKERRKEGKKERSNNKKQREIDYYDHAKSDRINSLEINSSTLAQSCWSDFAWSHLYSSLSGEDKDTRERKKERKKEKKGLVTLFGPFSVVQICVFAKARRVNLLSRIKGDPRMSQRPESQSLAVEATTVPLSARCGW